MSDDCESNLQLPADIEIEIYDSSINDYRHYAGRIKPDPCNAAVAVVLVCINEQELPTRNPQ